MIYRRIPRLFPELTLAHGDGTYPTVLARFARVDVLILDDWGLVGLKDAQRQDLLEILDDRDGNRSTIITSQLPIDRWHEHLGDPTLADAILDRVVHRAHRLALTGPSRRKANGNGSSAAEGGGMRRQTPIAEGCHGSGDLRSSLYTASCAVALEARQPVDRAGAMENAQHAFPTAPWTAHRTRRPQRPTGIHLCRLEEEKNKNHYNDARHSRRLIDNTDVLASLRSDHDAAEPVITMLWNA